MGMTGSVFEIDGALPHSDSHARAPEGSTLSEVPRDCVPSETVKSPTTPWWLWWNTLSADAPTVAIVWAALFASASRVRLSAAVEIVLSLVVWVIYISDRLLDGWIVKSHTVLRERHVFCARHRVALACLVVLVSAGIIWLTAVRLVPVEVSAGIKLGAIVSLYMVVVHAGGGRIARSVPKEIAVGVLFAAGTTLPIWSQSRGFSWGVWVSLALFALLCSLNCLSIECWENHGSDDLWRQTPDPFVTWANSHISWISAALGGFALMVFFVRHSGPQLLAVFWGALLILLLDLCRNRLSRPALRVLADVALVTAGLIGLIIRI